MIIPNIWKHTSHVPNHQPGRYYKLQSLHRLVQLEAPRCWNSFKWPQIQVVELRDEGQQSKHWDLWGGSGQWFYEILLSCSQSAGTSQQRSISTHGMVATNSNIGTQPTTSVVVATNKTRGASVLCSNMFWGIPKDQLPETTISAVSLDDLSLKGLW